jgi:hypothetical protein
MTDDCVTIESQEAVLDADDARQQIRDPPRTGTRIKHWLVGADVESLTLSYKPFYAFEAVLRNEGRFGSDEDKEGHVVVDAVTGIVRARPEGYATHEEVTVSPDVLVARELDVNEARATAENFQVKLEQRESREATLGETPTEIYKPIWIATLDTGDQCVVDAVNSEVFSDVSLWQALPFRS